MGFKYTQDGIKRRIKKLKQCQKCSMLNGREMGFLDDMIKRCQKMGVNTTMTDREEAFMYRIFEKCARFRSSGSSQKNRPKPPRKIRAKR